VDAPVDGFSVEHTPGAVTLILSNRYGEGEQYTLDPVSAGRIGLAMLTQALDAIEETRPLGD
jgi:hypothetical protein